MGMLKIDDVVDAGPVHFWCGMWGVLAVGLFAESGINDSYEGGDGVVHGSGKQFGYQIKFVIYIILWVLASSLVMFVPLRLMRLLVSVRGGGGRPGHLQSRCP